MFGINLFNWIIILQTASMIATIVLILIQQRGASIGGVFGSAGEVYLTKRGIEKWVVNFTVLFISIFVVLRILTLFI